MYYIGTDPLLNVNLIDKFIRHKSIGQSNKKSEKRNESIQQ